MDAPISVPSSKPSMTMMIFLFVFMIIFSGCSLCEFSDNEYSRYENTIENLNSSLKECENKIDIKDEIIDYHKSLINNETFLLENIGEEKIKEKYLETNIFFGITYNVVINILLTLQIFFTIGINFIIKLKNKGFQTLIVILGLVSIILTYLLN